MARCGKSEVGSTSLGADTVAVLQHIRKTVDLCDFVNKQAFNIMLFENMR